MKVILSDDEVREALSKAIEQKTDYILGEVQEDTTYFVITSSKGEVEDIETVEFVCDFDFNKGESEE